MDSIIKFLGETSSDPDKTILVDVLNRVFREKCVVCLGTGHVAKECGTKKDIDHHFRLMRYSVEWGKVKSVLMSETIKRFQTELRKRSQTESTVLSGLIGGNAEGVERVPGLNRSTKRKK